MEAILAALLLLAGADGAGEPLRLRIELASPVIAFGSGPVVRAWFDNPGPRARTVLQPIEGAGSSVWAWEVVGPDGAPGEAAGARPRSDPASFAPALDDFSLIPPGGDHEVRARWLPPPDRAYWFARPGRYRVRLRYSIPEKTVVHLELGDPELRQIQAVFAALERVELVSNEVEVEVARPQGRAAQRLTALREVSLGMSRWDLLHRVMGPADREKSDGRRTELVYFLGERPDGDAGDEGQQIETKPRVVIRLSPDGRVTSVAKVPIHAPGG